MGLHPMNWENYLQPAALILLAYIFPIRPMPMIPTVMFLAFEPIVKIVKRSF